MKKSIFLVCVLAFVVVRAVSVIDILDSNFRVAGRLNGNELQDSNYRTIGRIDGNEIQDANHRTIGRADGTPTQVKMVALLVFFFFLSYLKPKVLGDFSKNI